MHLTPLLAFATSAITVAAAPAEPAGPQIVTADDVVLYGNGRYQVMKRSEFHEKFAHLDLNTTYPPLHLDPNRNPNSIVMTGVEAEALDKRGPLRKRKDKDHEIVIMGEYQRFYGWDVQTSPILKGVPNTGTYISVSSGYSITASVQAGATGTITAAKNALDLKGGIDKTWSTANSRERGLAGFVAPGKWGCFVSNPWTNRQQGWVWTGEVGTNGLAQPFQVDWFESKKYETFEWVDGLMTICQGDNWPLKRCRGEGYLGYTP